MCRSSHWFVFIALLSAATALRAENGSTVPPPNAPAAQNSADPTSTAPAAAPSAPAQAAPAATVASPSQALPTTIEPRPEYGQFAGIINLPADVDLTSLSDVIVHAASARGWLVLSHANGKVIITNQSGNWTSQLTLLWTPDKIVIYSNSTKNGKPKLPRSWIDFLRQDIARALNPTAAVPAKKSKSS
ncbi:MAG TPA: hypothetical protein VIM69_05145 [Opitutaceae bacterium]